MARQWTLGDTTLPNPHKFMQRPIEQAVKHEMINGTYKKDVSARKWQYILEFHRINQETVASIIAEYSREETLSFSAEDGDLIVNATDVHVEIADRKYLTKGSEFREHLKLILTEVS